MNKHVMSTTLKYIVMVTVGLITCAGLVSLYQLDSSVLVSLYKNEQFLRQILYVLIGLLLARVLQGSRGYLWYRDVGSTKKMFLGSLVLLLLVLVVGVRVNGAKSWFDFGLFSLQPSDLVKILFITFLSHFYERRHIYIRHPATLLVPIGALTAVCALVLMQPDFGTVVVFSVIWFAITVAAGLWWRHIVALFGMLGIVAVCSWMFLLAGYQKNRIYTFLEPERDPYGSGYNVIQSKIAIGAAGLLGFGVGEGTQARLGFLPEHHTDFIFASFVEEWGAVGGFVIIAAYITLIVSMLWAARYTERVSDSLFLVGYAAMIGVHGGIHIGMNMGLLPVTGLPMPFMSFGGSHIIAEFIGLGVVLSVITRLSPDRVVYDVEYYGSDKLSLYKHN